MEAGEGDAKTRKGTINDGIKDTRKDTRKGTIKDTRKETRKDKAMADITPIISKPLSPTEISEVLRRSQDDFGVISPAITHDVGTVCVHDNINIWAKYKPMHYATLLPLSESQRTDRQGDGEYYGITISARQQIQNIENVRFQYNRPQGGSTSPYRLSDFLDATQSNGYNHQAKPEFSGQLMSDSIVYDDGYNIQLQMTTLSALPTGSIDLLGILGSNVRLQTMYPILVVRKTTATMPVYAIAMRTANENGMPEVLPLGLNATGLFYASLVCDYPEDENGDIRRPDNFPTPGSDGTVDCYMSIGLSESVKQTGIFDLTTWTEVSGSLSTHQIIGIPRLPASSLSKIPVHITVADMEYKVSVNMTVLGSSAFIFIKPMYDTFTMVNPYKVYAVFRTSGGSQVQATKSISMMNIGTSISGNVGFTASDFGIMMVEGIDVSGYLTVSVSNGNSTSVGIVNQSVTFTYDGSSGGSSGGSGGGSTTTPEVTVDLQDQWQASSVAVSGYKVYESFSNYNVNSGVASMKITIKNKPDFYLYINSFAEGIYDYTIAWALDTEPASNPSKNSTGVKATTSGGQADPAQGELAFTPVSYANDGGEHTIWVTYRKDSSQHSNNDKGYVAIPD